MNFGKKQNIRGFLVGLAFLVFIVFGAYQSCFQVTNEIGPIGADKAGRQIMIQTLDEVYRRSGRSVTSEWADTSLLWRLIIGTPMRTTIRFVASPSLREFDPSAPEAFLRIPYKDFFAQFKTPPDAYIWLRENYKIPLNDFYTKLDELGAQTMEDMFAAMGFRKFELVHGDKLTSIKLKVLGRDNIKWHGDEG